MQVKQLTNLFDLLDLFIQEKRPLSVREMVDELEWPRSSAFNMVSTLVESGYLYQPVSRGGYYPTTKWLEVARELTESQPLPESVHTLLADLAHQTGETLFLAAPEGTNVVFLDVVESTADIRFIANVGRRLPIHITSAGRAILSQYSPAERTRLLKRVDYRENEKDSFRTMESVEQDIRDNSANGWFINLGIYASGVGGVAVPFPFRGRRNAISLGGPVSRIEPKVEAMGRLLRDAVADFLNAEDS